MNAPSSSQIIDVLGGPTAVARLLGIKPPSVHEWRAKGIPIDKLIRLGASIESATGNAVRRWHLCPMDWHRIWPELVGAEGAPELPASAEPQTEGA